jgi:hypothetical protein
LDTPKPYLKTETGMIARLELRLMNMGNAVDSYGLKVDGLEELNRAGFDAMLDKNMLVKVASGSNRSVTVTVIALSGWEPHRSLSAEIRINVTSLNAGEYGSNVSAACTLRVEERGFNVPAVLALIAVIAAPALAAGGAILLRKRRRSRNKTVKEYMKELGLEQGD